MFGSKLSKEEREAKHAMAMMGLAAVGLGLQVDDKTGTIYPLSDKKAGGLIKGAKASVESEGEIRDRFTATRILAIGIFALAFKKKTSDKDVFVVIEGDGYVITQHVPTKKEQAARAFARQFNALA